MSEDANGEAASSPDAEPPKRFTAAERIEELNNIDKSISTLLGSAASAIDVLANTPTPGRASLESQKAAFTAATEAFLSTLSEIDVRLRRNVYALEEASLVQRDGKRTVSVTHGEEIRAGGHNSLDSSWLNARASNSVTKAMDQEIWADARSFVERLQAKRPDGQETGARDEMDVDEVKHG